MKKNKLYVFLAILTSIFLLSTAAIFNQCGVQTEIETDKEEEIGKTGEEEEAFDQDPLDEPEIYGDGEILITFEVKVPDWTPVEDNIYLYIDGFYYGSGGGIPMEEKDPGIFAASFKALENQVLKYRYNRNNYGFSTDEEFSPDSEEARREIDVGIQPIFVGDEVKNWRWLTSMPPEALISEFRPDSLPERSGSFIVGAATLDFYNPLFNDFVSSTLKRISDSKIDYIGISYAPSSFTGTEPLTISDEHINTYTEEELEFMITEARKKGMKIMLSAGIETDPRTAEAFERIEEAFKNEHEDEWYIQLVGEWEKSMLKTAELAERYEIEIFAPSNQWPFWGDQADGQKIILNDLINDAYLKIRDIYSGIITSDYYAPDEYFDYYKQLDWIGDKWWWEIADKKETTIEEMKAESENIIGDRYQQIYRKYNKPILLHQLAYSSYDGAAGAEQINTEGPEVSEYYPYNPDYPFDFQEQADAYEAVFQSIYDEPIFIGVFSFSYTYWDSYDKSAGIRSKPAEDVWMKWSTIFD
ncbi:MAG: hypothetical protein V3R31_00510 [Candidatus Humimicrobiaceae bacterium]